MKKVHFIGIGGIGISAIARFLKEKDFIISGSDIGESLTTKALRKSGIKVTVPHSAQAIEDPDFVVYSALFIQLILLLLCHANRCSLHLPLVFSPFLPQL